MSALPIESSGSAAVASMAQYASLHALLLLRNGAIVPIGRFACAQLVSIITNARRNFCRQSGSNKNDRKDHDNKRRGTTKTFTAASLASHFSWTIVSNLLSHGIGGIVSSAFCFFLASSRSAAVAAQGGGVPVSIATTLRLDHLFLSRCFGRSPSSLAAVAAVPSSIKAILFGGDGKGKCSATIIPTRIDITAMLATSLVVEATMRLLVAKRMIPFLGSRRVARRKDSAPNTKKALPPFITVPSVMGVDQAIPSTFSDPSSSSSSSTVAAPTLLHYYAPRKEFSSVIAQGCALAVGHFILSSPLCCLSALLGSSVESSSSSSSSSSSLGLLAFAASQCILMNVVGGALLGPLLCKELRRKPQSNGNVMSSHAALKVEFESVVGCSWEGYRRGCNDDGAINALRDFCVAILEDQQLKRNCPSNGRSECDEPLSDVAFVVHTDAALSSEEGEEKGGHSGGGGIEPSFSFSASSPPAEISSVPSPSTIGNVPPASPTSSGGGGGALTATPLLITHRDSTLVTYGLLKLLGTIDTLTLAADVDEGSSSVDDTTFSSPPYYFYQSVPVPPAEIAAGGCSTTVTVAVMNPAALRIFDGIAIVFGGGSSHNPLLRCGSDFALFKQFLEDSDEL